VFWAMTSTVWLWPSAETIGKALPLLDCPQRKHSAPVLGRSDLMEQFIVFRGYCV